MFKNYYNTKFNKVNCPSDIEHREFGFVFWDYDKFVRHVGFETVFKNLENLGHFEFDYINRYFQSYGTEITVIHQQPTRSMQEELVQDLIAIITSFSGRV